MTVTFKALRVEQPEKKIFTRAIVERHVDYLPAGELLIRVDYSSLNFKDALSATGNPGVTRNYPHTPWIDKVGLEGLEEKIQAMLKGEIKRRVLVKLT